MDEKIVEGFRSKTNLCSLINEVKEEIVKTRSKRDDIMEEIKRDITRAIPNCEIHFFGSQVTSIGTEKSDFDIYIDYDCMSYTVELDREVQMSKLVEWWGKLHSLQCFNVICVLPARVQILQMYHTGHLGKEILCDLNCRSGLGVENSLLIRELLSSDFRVCWLVITVKWWMKHNNLLDKHKFTSYSTSWLVFFFLMQTQPNVLKPVSDMQQGCPRRIVGGWDCRFDRNFYPTKYRTLQNKDKRIKLLAKFFNFYRTFDFQNVVLCPLNGTVIPKNEFDSLRLPATFVDYVNLARRDPNKIFDTNCNICIQDPFELSHNITKVVKPGDLEKFQRLCRESLKMPIFSSYGYVF